MYTGLITEVGAVVDLDGDGVVVAGPKTAAGLPAGGSVTVGRVPDRHRRRPRGGTFRVVLSAETRRRSVAGEWRPADPVNLELPLRAGDPLDGHLVQGHVDAVGKVAAAGEEPGGRRVDPPAPPVPRRPRAQGLGGGRRREPHGGRDRAGPVLGRPGPRHAGRDHPGRPGGGPPGQPGVRRRRPRGPALAVLPHRGAGRGVVGLPWAGRLEGKVAVDKAGPRSPPAGPWWCGTPRPGGRGRRRVRRGRLRPRRSRSCSPRPAGTPIPVRRRGARPAGDPAHARPRRPPGHGLHLPVDPPPWDRRVGRGRAATVGGLADPRPGWTTSCGPATCSRCGPGTASWPSGAGTPRPASPWSGPPAWRRWRRCARSWAPTGPWPGRPTSSGSPSAGAADGGGPGPRRWRLEPIGVALGVSAEGRSPDSTLDAQRVPQVGRPAAPLERRPALPPRAGDGDRPVARRRPARATPG